MILPSHTLDDIRRRHDILVAVMAYEYRCERDDILAAIQPQPSKPSQAPAAPPATQAQEKAEVVAPPASATPFEPQEHGGGTPPAQMPAAEAVLADPAESGVVTSVAGQEGIAGQQPIQESRPAETRQGTGDAALSENTAAHGGLEGIERQEGATPDTGKPAEASVSAAPPRGEITRKVREAIEQHPDWTARQIEEATGVPHARVNTTAHRLGISPRRLTEEEREVILQEAGAKGARVKASAAPPPEPDEPPAPALRLKLPKSTKFRLRQHLGRGKYLHMGGEGLVDSKAYAWIGTADQLAKVREKFADASGMVEEVVE